MGDHAHFGDSSAHCGWGGALRNRIALTSTTTNYGARNRVTDRWISFLAEARQGRRRNDHHRNRRGRSRGTVPDVDRDWLRGENDDGFKRAADAVEGEGPA